MPDQLQLRGGTTTETNSFTGAAREVTVDTTKKTAVVHDGSTAGGNPLLREDGSNSALALGSQGTPSLKFTGDTNTGIYSPGADQVAISTGGTGKLFIDANGRVGIGETSPESLLHLKGSSATVKIENSVNTNYSAVEFDRAADDTHFAIYAYDSSHPNHANNVQIYGYQAGRLDFHTNSSVSPRLSIASGGNVGIGTTLPDSNLEIVNSTASANNSLLKLHSSASTSSANLILEVNNGGTAQAGIRLDTSNKLHLQTYGSGALNNVLTLSDSNVGIGVTSPGHNLDLIGTTTSAFRIRSNAASGRGLEIWNNSGTDKAYISNYYSGSLIFQTGNTPRAEIDGSGRLLVGTSSSRIVYGGNANTRVLVETSEDDYDTCLALVHNQNTGANAALRAGVISLSRTRGISNGSNTIVQSGDALGYIVFEGADGTNTERAAEIKAQVDGTPGANVMPGRLVFSTTADGASSPTERMRIDRRGFTQQQSTTSAIGIETTQAAGTTYNLIIGRYGATIGSLGSGTLSFLVQSNGNVQNTNNSYDAISDSKLKENIVDAGSQWSDIKSLRVRNYNFKEETGHQTHTQIGLIAQELELTSPGLVTSSPDLDREGNDLGTVTKGVKYSVLYMKAVKALQEAMERIETLEAEVAALKAG